MHLQVKAVCKAAKAKKDNTSTIAIQYCYTSEKRALLDSGLSIPPQYWIEKKGRVSDALPETFGNAIELNHQLHQELKC
ncbi:MAG: tyrosine-type recombinase/integrase, partial [Ferruginibacter sp.]